MFRKGKFLKALDGSGTTWCVVPSPKKLWDPQIDAGGTDLAIPKAMFFQSILVAAAKFLSLPSYGFDPHGENMPPPHGVGEDVEI